MAEPDIVAAVVTKHAMKLTQLLQELQLPQPTFGEIGSYAFDSDKYPAVESDALRQARNALLNAASELSHLAMGPAHRIISVAWSTADASNLAVLVRLGIPEKVPQHGSKDLATLAQELGVDETIVSSAVRYAVSNGIFSELKAGVITHTAASARSASDRNLRDYCAMCVAEIGELVGKLPETVAQKQQLQEKGPASASNVAYPDYENIFHYF